MMSKFKSVGLRIGIRGATLGLASLALSAGVYAQGAGRTGWSGVYTADQAARGKVAYDATCAACHGATLAGSDSAPALAGAGFLANWAGTSAGDLFERIHTTMPAGDPGSLAGPKVVDIEAYLFQANGFPAGNTPLPTAGQALANVQIVATKSAGT